MKAKKTTVHDASVIGLPMIKDRAGNITAINSSDEVPFDIQRVYYLYDIPGGESRGGHGHKELHQLIVAASGSFSIILKDGQDERKIDLKRPNEALLMPPGLWREIVDFSSGSICLVLASHAYDEGDYIRDFKEFVQLKRS